MAAAMPRSVVAVFLATCCVTSVGLCAATMESTVTTDPADVVDVPTELAPFGRGTLDDLRERVARPSEPVTRSKAAKHGTPSEGVSVQRPDADAAGTPQSETERRTVGGDQADSDVEAARNGDDDSSQGTGRSDQDGPADGGTHRSLLDWLVSLLPWLLGIVVLGAAATYYRDRIVAMVRRLLGSRDGSSTATDATAGAVPTPTNEVSRAWNEMVSVLGLERRPSKTPTEYAVDAVRAGADRDVVDALTRTFQEVRYGGFPVTDERVQQAREALAAVRPGTTGEYEP